MAGFTGWEAAVLRSIGAPATKQNYLALRAWQTAEGGSAHFNPLNTTQPADGATAYNSVGVRNFTSARQGVQATAKTLLNGHYGDIVNLLRSGKASAQEIGTAVSHSPWGTGSGVLRVLGQPPSKTAGGVGPVTYPPTSDGNGGLGPLRPPAPSSGLSQQSLASMASAVLLQQSAATAAGAQPDSSGLLALAVARRQVGAAQQSFGAQPTTQALQRPQASKGLAIPIEGSIGSENPNFLSAVTHAAKARGAVKIVATSGERSPEHNRAVGGATHSNHLPDAQGLGHALDGYAVLGDGSRIPLGQFLLPNAGKFGLRSGATFNWGGKPDVVHVDDFKNQGV